jgi:hypothetical protein
MEKKMAKFEEAMPKKDEEEMEEDEDEDELPKLNGAPVEQKMSKVANVKSIKNGQSSFLSKLYK